MRRIILIITIVFSTVNMYCQTTIQDFLDIVDGIYANIDDELVPTNILLDQGFRNIDDLILREQTQSDYYNYWAIYTNLQRCKHGSPESYILPVFESLVNREDYKDNLHTSIPLSYIFYKGNYLGADETLKFFEDKDYIPTISDKELFALSVMIPGIYNSNVTFDLKQELIFSNATSEINRLEIDFGDGSGFRNVNIDADNITINYDCIGEKSIVAKLYTANDTLVANSKITVKAEYISEPSITGTVNSEAFLKSTGTVVGGDYRCELGSDNVLDKPILIVEGFDLLNNYSENEKYTKWENILSDLQADGYDVFCLSFSDAKRSMHENKEVVKAMINKINKDKTGNFEGVIIGESMGGILSRMALKEMENDGIDHQIGLYVSFDSPHKGANIPPGFQMGFKDAVAVVSDVSDVVVPFLGIFKGIFGDFVTYEVIDQTINSTAAKQLLSRHSSGTSQFDAMQTYLNGLGYPEDSRNIALINGNNQGDNLSFSPGDRIFNHQWKWTALLGHYHELTLNSTAVNTNNQLVSNITIVSIVIPDVKWYHVLSGIPPTPYPAFVYKKRYYTSDNKAYDNCPGGVFEIDEVDLDIDAFSFVPTSSSIDLDESVFNTANGLHHLTASNTKDDIINNNQTPFDDIYASTANTGHVYVNHWKIQPRIQELIDREIMYDNLFIQNRTIANDRDFEASNSIEVGNNVDNQAGKNIKTGSVVFKSGSTVTLSAPSIVLGSGTTIEKACSFNAKASTATTTLKSAKVSSSEKSTAINFVPSISKKKSENKDCYYLKNISEADLSPISWHIYSYNFEYQSTGPEFIIPHNIPTGQYTLKASIQKGNSQQSLTKVLNITGNYFANKIKKEQITPSLSEGFEIKTYPNPTNASLYITQQGSKTAFTVSIFDLNGNKLLEKEIVEKGVLDMSNHKGFFLLKVEQNGVTITRKIVSH